MISFRSLLLSVVVVVAASPAAARHGGLYFELAPAYGFFLTDDIIIEQGDSNDSTRLPTATFVPQVKLGVNLFGWGGVEAQVAGQYWDVGADVGGAGYVGGVLRLTPLEALSFVLSKEPMLPSLVPEGPVTWSDRPFDVGLSVGGGYTIAGEDYAYQGAYFQWGIDFKWFLTPNFAIGVDLPIRHTLYDPFRYTNYNEKVGLCTEGADAFGRGGIPIPDSPTRIPPLELSATDGESECTGNAPSGVLVAPALTFTGVFDFGI
jgi:hypothetical protein